MRIGVFGADRLGVLLSEGVVDIGDLAPRMPGARGPLSWFISHEWDRDLDWAQVVAGRPVLAATGIRWSPPLPGCAVVDPSGRAPAGSGASSLGIVLAGSDASDRTVDLADGAFGIVRVRRRGDGSLGLAAEPIRVTTIEAAVSVRDIVAGVREGRALGLAAADVVVLPR